MFNRRVPTRPTELFEVLAAAGKPSVQVAIRIRLYEVKNTGSSTRLGVDD